MDNRIHFGIARKSRGQEKRTLRLPSGARSKEAQILLEERTIEQNRKRGTCARARALPSASASLVITREFFQRPRCVCVCALAVSRFFSPLSVPSARPPSPHGLSRCFLSLSPFILLPRLLLAVMHAISVKVRARERVSRYTRGNPSFYKPRARACIEPGRSIARSLPRPPAPRPPVERRSKTVGAVGAGSVGRSALPYRERSSAPWSNAWKERKKPLPPRLLVVLRFRLLSSFSARRSASPRKLPRSSAGRVCILALGAARRMRNLRSHLASPPLPFPSSFSSSLRSPLVATGTYTLLCYVLSTPLDDVSHSVASHTRPRSAKPASPAICSSSLVETGGDIVVR